MVRFAGLFLLATAAFGQHVSLGVIAGVPFTDLVSNGTSTHYTWGPSVQVRLPFGFGIEADALYRPLDYAGPGGVPNSGSQWSFPILVQYRLGALPLVHPYVEAGASFDHITGIQQTVASSNNAADLLKKSNAGFVLGVGLEVKLPIIRVTPELRFTRQRSADFRGISNQNQAEFLVGFRF